MAARHYNVLFVSTGNAARSIIAEACLNRSGDPRFSAFSAGSHPTGEIRRLALDLLDREQICTDGFRSKSWDEFGKSNSPWMDFVVTLCDRAAAITPPFWPGTPMAAHWGVADPMAFGDTVDEKRRSFDLAAQDISCRIEKFVALPIELVDSLVLHRHLKTIGHSPRRLGAPTMPRPRRDD